MTKLGPKRPTPPISQPKPRNIATADRQTDDHRPRAGRMMTAQLPYPPSANHLRIPARGRLITSPEYRTWQETAEWIIRQAMTPVVRYPAAIWITLQTANTRRDVDNAVKPTLDALVKAGILADDNLKHVNRLFVSHQPGYSECVYVSIEAL